MRSRTGCLTCRARKIRCDEGKPICGQCAKGKRTCTQGSGVAFRHQQNASLNAGSLLSSGSSPRERAQSPGSKSLKSFFAYRQTFSDEHVWLTIPRNVTFVHVQDPYADQPEEAIAGNASGFAAALPATELSSVQDDGFVEWSQQPSAVATMSARAKGARGSLDILSAAASVSSNPFVRGPRTTAAALNISAVAISPPEDMDRPRSAFDLSPASDTLSPTGPRKRPRTSDSLSGGSPAMRAPTSQDMFASTLSPRMHGLGSSGSSIAPPPEVETDAEVAFLLRHYSEAPGYGMDLFDCGRYFSFHVPIKARSHALLKTAACAYAAKHLWRVNGLKYVYGGNCSQLASMEIWSNPDQDWYYVACKYYHRALALVLEVLGVPKNRADGDEDDGGDGRIDGGSTSGMSGTGTAGMSEELGPSSTSDELLAATAILCEYEAMDMSDAAWSRHLNGTKSLLDIAEIGMRPAGSYDVLEREAQLFAGSRKAIFWNFARQDFASAFITQCQTRLDVNNFDMWRAAGLDLDVQGFLVHTTDPVSRFGNDNHSREDMIANSLILILMRLNNYLTAGENLSSIPGNHVEDTLPMDDSRSAGGSTRLGISQQTLLGRWRCIEIQLLAWHASLPETFLPCASVPHPVFSETWYPISMVASAMQNYHMGMILLLINKPHETTVRRTTVTVRLKSYHAIAAEIRRHAEQICAIALSRTEGSARIFSIQPLFVAGQCMTEQQEREIIVDLLRGIEKDLGWATEWRVNQLLTEWQNDDEA